MERYNAESCPRKIEYRNLSCNATRSRTEDHDALFLLVKWCDEGAFAEHREQAHFKRLGELKEKYVDDTAIEKYEAEG